MDKWLTRCSRGSNTVTWAVDLPRPTSGFGGWSHLGDSRVECSKMDVWAAQYHDNWVTMSSRRMKICTGDLAW